MSYCRWSDCDIYAYEAADGFMNSNRPKLAKSLGRLT